MLKCASVKAEILFSSSEKDTPVSENFIIPNRMASLINALIFPGIKSALATISSLSFPI